MTGMFAVHRPALACALCLPLLAAAQDAASPLPQRGGEPIVQRVVTEDDGVRIEELRVRGETQQINVQSKAGGVRSYQIVPAAAGRDLSQDRRNTGQRVWSVLSF